MKKIASLLIALVAIVGFSTLASCSGKDDAAKVAEKIQFGDNLTPEEYSVVINYLGKFAETAQPIQDKINNLPATDAAAETYQQQLDALKKENPYLDLFKTTLEKASQSEVGADNVALVDKYAGYEWFTAPDWATIQTDPEAAGIEMESPAQDTSAVVAGGVVDVEVK